MGCGVMLYHPAKNPAQGFLEEDLVVESPCCKCRCQEKHGEAVLAKVLQVEGLDVLDEMVGLLQLSMVCYLAVLQEDSRCLQLH